MSFTEYEERPTKKRRFFVENTPTPSPSPPSENASTTDLAESTALEQQHDHAFETEAPQVNVNKPVENSTSSGLALRPNGFDSELLESIIGEKLSEHVISILRDKAGNDVEQAINLYFDGSWKNEAQARSTKPSQPSISSFADTLMTQPVEETESGINDDANAQSTSVPSQRYIGAFGATCWAIRSGVKLAPGESVTIERLAPKQPANKIGRGGKSKAPPPRKTQDTVVRFTNQSGQEVGRLESDVASWISTLLDQGICHFDATCVYAPEIIRTNETIYLQLRAFLCHGAFENSAFMKPADSNRQISLFEAKETREERNLHLRQVALVKLFTEINLHPTKENATTERHKRQGLLKAAEIAEQFEQGKGDASTNGGSSPPSEEAEEDGEELEQDQLDTLYEKAQSFDFNTPQYEPAETFTMDLRKYQKQALHWMIGKETDQKANETEMSMHPLWEEYEYPVADADDKPLPKFSGREKFYVNPYSGELSLKFPRQEQNCLGGILADEMGLGKTIEMLSLIHSHKSKLVNQPSRSGTLTLDLPRLPSNSSEAVFAPATTLVVAPMSLLAQWHSEAIRASKEGTLKAMLYYGDERVVNLQNLCCEANAATAPNVIITSYGVILSEFNRVRSNNGNRGSDGGLFSLDYFRIILDEAHSIKNRQSKTAKACYELKAKHRWVLTGTPIVNRLEDLFSLVHFLKVEPWSNFSFWKTFITVPFESGNFVKALDVVQTVLEPLVLRRTKDMKTPDGEALVPLPPRIIEIENIALSKEEKEVYDHILVRAKRTFSANAAAGTLMKSYTTIFAQILRLRQSCCHPTLTRNKDIVLEEEEAAAAADIANGLSDDMDLTALIERFSAAQEEDQDANKFGAHALQQIQDEAESECPVCCEEPMINQAVTSCWHSACKDCLVDYVERQTAKNEVPLCFNCREPVSLRDVFEVVRHEDEISPSKKSPKGMNLDTQASQIPRVSLRRINQISSAKITALLSNLTSLRKTNPGVKSVVFSQFTSFLDLIEPVLKQARIPFLRFDGSMAQKRRAEVLAAFAAPPEDIKTKNKGLVLLLSLRAGGVGLNLTCAQRVYMMDPWWSWAVEAQAIDRVHRMGQDHEVKVTRFIVDESIEQKMLKIQERKKFIASSLGMMSQEEARTQKLEEIRELLSM